MSNHDFSALSSVQQMEAAVDAVKSAAAAMFQKKKYGVTLDQWKVMGAAASVDAPTQSNIASASGKDPAAVTRMVSLLEKKGLVKRKAQKGDKRSHHVVLTAKGKALAKRVKPAMTKMMTAAMKDVSSRDQSTLKRIAQTIANNVS